MDFDLGEIYVPALLAAGGLALVWALILVPGLRRDDFHFTLDPYLLPHEDDSEEEVEIRREMRQRSARRNAVATGLGGLVLLAVGILLLLL